eukprot:snap_masked-scaffold_5-processed-gene-0.16-mRNA-1 protein AED:1.00 eAED:1.00 QI:0/0/0/0/1/1/2/0/100
MYIQIVWAKTKQDHVAIELELSGSFLNIKSLFAQQPTKNLVALMKNTEFAGKFDLELAKHPDTKSRYEPDYIELTKIISKIQKQTHTTINHQTSKKVQLC